ncbi:MAG TPA: hypothetical protein VHD87_15235 [Acidimicrobiales bacterium]|nr:hypothetical protein [Acidimicrobiales bacterium]
MGTPTLLYRYRLVEAWGSFASAVGDADHLLERVDYGPERQWTIYDDAARAVTGGGVGEFVGTVALCGCGSFTATTEHPATPRCTSNP